MMAGLRVVPATAMADREEDTVVPVTVMADREEDTVVPVTVMADRKEDTVVLVLVLVLVPVMANREEDTVVPVTVMADREDTEVPLGTALRPATAHLRPARGNSPRSMLSESESECWKVREATDRIAVSPRRSPGISASITYRMPDHPPTSVETLRGAREIGYRAGLRYVCESNVPGEGGENTCRYDHEPIGRLMVSLPQGHDT
jgi:hypothetical protein